MIFNFFLKADIEYQYMHLGCTFNALSNDANSIYKLVFGGELSFHNFILIFSFFFRWVWL